LNRPTTAALKSAGASAGKTAIKRDRSFNRRLRAWM
jgi:hypothetical protein